MEKMRMAKFDLGADDTEKKVNDLLASAITLAPSGFIVEADHVVLMYILDSDPESTSDSLMAIQKAVLKEMYGRVLAAETALRNAKKAVDEKLGGAQKKDAAERMLAQHEDNVAGIRRDIATIHEIMEDIKSGNFTI